MSDLKNLHIPEDNPEYWDTERCVIPGGIFATYLADKKIDRDYLRILRICWQLDLISWKELLDELNQR